jgi:hypothetical protein
MPRCFEYHSYIFCGALALKKIPPSPITRFFDFESKFFSASPRLRGEIQLRFSDLAIFRCPDLPIVHLVQNPFISYSRIAFNSAALGSGVGLTSAATFNFHPVFASTSSTLTPG